MLCDLVEPALMEIGLSVDPEGSGGRLRETRLWVTAAAATTKGEAGDGAAQPKEATRRPKEKRIC